MTLTAATQRHAMAAALAVAALILPRLLLAHAVVYPQRSTPGAYERYLLRVPNERPVPTTRVELAFPPEVTVVSFGEVPGWTVEVRRASDGRITGAVWTGEIGVERFVELPFIAVNPQQRARLEWRAVQTYAGGEVVRWEGPEGAERPASFTLVAPIEGGAGPALPLAALALVVGMVSLGLVLRRGRPSRAAVPADDARATRS